MNKERSVLWLVYSEVPLPSKMLEACNVIMSQGPWHYAMTRGAQSIRSMAKKLGDCGSYIMMSGTLEKNAGRVPADMTVTHGSYRLERFSESTSMIPLLNLRQGSWFFNGIECDAPPLPEEVGEARRPLAAPPGS